MTGTLLVWSDDQDPENGVYVPVDSPFVTAAIEEAVEAWAEHAESGGRFAGGEYPNGDVMHVRHVESGKEWRAVLRTDWSPTWLVDGITP